MLVHAHGIIDHVQKETSEVVLFHSLTGKDSIAMLEMLSAKFERVHCVYMYMFKDFEFLNPYREAVLRYPNTTLQEVPHFVLSTWARSGLLGKPMNTRELLLKDIMADVRAGTGIDWISLGWKSADSMQRGIIMRQYYAKGIDIEHKKFFPLSSFKKQDVLNYIKIKGLIQPLNFGAKGAGSGIDFSLPFIKWLKQHHPEDHDKLLDTYPNLLSLLYGQHHQISKLQN